MRTTVTIPDEKLERLLVLTGTANRTAAVNEAIDAYLRRAATERLIALKGRVDIASNEEIESFDDAEFRGE